MKAFNTISWGIAPTDLYITTKRMCYVGFLLSLMACSTSDPSGQSTKDSSRKTIVESYFEAAFAQDYSTLEDLLSEDFLFLGPKISDTLDKQALIKSWKSTHQRNDTLLMRKPKVYDVSAQEGLSRDSSLVLHYYDARFHNSDLNLWVEFPVHVKFILFKDKIHQAQIIINQSDIQSQLGYTITPPKI
ncbi:nuclear transport factor 2 family protein [Muriicola sp. Z0-33]|uniref:nuclear transport factor 2 family protein n=1 Tax=Muriicola sp. Z0-33 TaxID=2816957 RepID=UPI00223848EF|nr:nuclear transport factor 2 family protein [Muriicola sp. Z0-33]MCW5518155.1 nuclear transport factor 2 family protein [Muriicola sp. Z0-33]